MLDATAIDKAIALGSKSVALDTDVARTYAACSRFAENEDERQKFAARVFDSLNGAVSRGLTRGDLQSVADINATLAEDPRWRSLTAKARPASPSSRASFMLDPLPELLPKL